MKKYTFNSQEYYDLDDLRQAIWKANHLVFGDLTDELKTKLGISEEEYTYTKTEEKNLSDELNLQVREKQNRIAEIKDELLTAVLLDDTDTQTTLKTEYKELLS